MTDQEFKKMMLEKLEAIERALRERPPVYVAPQPYQPAFHPAYPWPVLPFDGGVRD